MVVQWLQLMGARDRTDFRDNGSRNNSTVVGRRTESPSRRMDRTSSPLSLFAHALTLSDRQYSGLSLSSSRFSVP